MSDEWKPKGAAAKLAYIQSNIANPDKTGRNDFHKFDYVQEHGIIELLRPLLRDLRCAVVSSPAAFEVRVDDAQTAKGKPQKLVTLVGELTFTDTDEPVDSLDRTIVGRFTGAGADEMDKAHAKAQTIFTKYALQKFFLIPTEKIEDGDATPAPELSSPRAQRTSSGGTVKPTAPKPTPKGKSNSADPSPASTDTSVSVDKIRTVFNRSGWDADKLKWGLVEVGAEVAPLEDAATPEAFATVLGSLSLDQATLLVESMGGSAGDLA